MLALLVFGLVVTGGALPAPDATAAPALKKPALSLRAPAPLFAPLPSSADQRFSPRFGLPEASAFAPGGSFAPSGSVAPSGSLLPNMPGGNSRQGSWLSGSYDTAAGLYRVSPLVLKYQIRQMRQIGGSRVYVDVGVQGDHQFNSSDSTVNTSSDGAFVGVGLHF
jgi:hypothetical protein